MKMHRRENLRLLEFTEHIYISWFVSGIKAFKVTINGHWLRVAWQTGKGEGDVARTGTTEPQGKP